MKLTIKNRKFPQLDISETEIDGYYKKHIISIFEHQMNIHSKWESIKAVEGLKKYIICVRDESGMYAVDSCEYFKNIQEALEYALRGAML